MNHRSNSSFILALVAILAVAFANSLSAQTHYQQDGYRIARAFPADWQEKTDSKPADFDLIKKPATAGNPQSIGANRPEPVAIPQNNLPPRLPLERNSPNVPPIVPADSLAHPFAQPDIKPVTMPIHEVGNYLQSTAETQDVYSQSAVSEIHKERYAKLFGGANWLINSDNAINRIATEQDGDYVVGLAIGKRISRGVRTELEYAYRANKGRWQIPAGVVTAPEFVGGTHFDRVQSGMANILLDLGKNRFFQPYAGVGIGLANYDGERRGTPGSNVVYTDIERGTNFAFQAMGGIEFQVRRAKWFTEYRYFATDGIGVTSSLEADYRVENLVFD